MKNFKLVFRFISLFALPFFFTSCFMGGITYIPGTPFNAILIKKIQIDKELSNFYTNDDEIEIYSILTSIILDTNRRLIVHYNRGEYIFDEFNITNKAIQKKFALNLSSDDKIMNIFYKDGKVELYISKDLDDNIYLLKTTFNLIDGKLLNDELIFTTNTEKEIDLDDVFELENSTKTYSKASHFKHAEKFQDVSRKKSLTKLIFDKDNNLLLIPVKFLYWGEEYDEIAYFFRQYYPKENKSIDFTQLLGKADICLLFNNLPFVDENNKVFFGCYTETNKIKKQNLFVSTNGETKIYSMDLPKEVSEYKYFDKYYDSISIVDLPKKTIIQDTRDYLYLMSIYVKFKRTHVYGKYQTITGINIKKFDKNSMKIMLENNIEFNKDLAVKEKFEEGIFVHFLNSCIDQEGNLFLIIDNTYELMIGSSYTSGRDKYGMGGTTTTSSSPFYFFTTIWLLNFDSKLSLNWLKKVVDRDCFDQNTDFFLIDDFEGISRDNFAYYSLIGNNISIRYLNKGKEIPAGIYQKTFSTVDGKEISTSTIFSVPE